LDARYRGPQELLHLFNLLVSLLRDQIRCLLDEVLVELLDGLNIDQERIHRQVHHNQVVLVVNELQEVFVGVYGVSLEVQLEDILDALDVGQLSHEVVLGQQSLHPSHVLEVFQRLKFVLRDVNGRYVLQPLADFLWHDLDEVLRDV
jgi:hypothetical protein